MQATQTTLPKSRPLFLADWDSVVMVHLEVDPDALQKVVPFPLGTYNGRGFVTLVAFTLRNMRPCFGGKLAAALLRPIATHEFLNVRTYVTVNGEPGIHFLAEWLPNRLSVWLGPRTFGLPYRLGRNRYQHQPEENTFAGRIIDARTGDSLVYQGVSADPEQPPVRARSGTLEFFLWERYTAFNDKNGKSLKFHVRHTPWPMRPLRLTLEDTTLLTRNWPFLANAPQIGAHFCVGLHDVRMSRIYPADAPTE